MVELGSASERGSFECIILIYLQDTFFLMTGVGRCFFINFLVLLLRHGMHVFNPPGMIFFSHRMH